MNTKMTTEECRTEYRAARNRACTGMAFSSLPSTRRFDAAVKARVAYYVGGATPAEWAAAANLVANDFIRRSNWREMSRSCFRI